MLKTGQIILLLFLFNYLYCAPDRYIRDNKGKIDKYDYSERDDEYAWSDANEDIGHDTPREKNPYYTRNRQERIKNNHYKETPPADDNYITERSQRPSYIIYDRLEKPDTREKTAIKNKNYNHPEKKISKSGEKDKAYKVRNGDSLTGIAKKFNMEVDYICSINRIKNPNDIYAGMILRLAPGQNSVKNIKKSNDKTGIKPSFEWPLREVVNVKRDGDDGVRSIGIIITGKNGSKIYSSAAGTVEKIGQMRGFGNFIIVKHPDRYFTIYSNLNNIFVSENEKVGTGKMIGRLDGNKLHFQIDNSGKPEDPLKYLSRKR